MTARWEPDGARFRAVCDTPGCPRPLDWTVDTEEHARNVARKHDREQHPGHPLDVPSTPEAQAERDAAPLADLDLHSAAHALLIEWEQPVWVGGTTDPDPETSGRWSGMLALWQALTGARDEAEALRLARIWAAQPTTAHVAPF